MITADNNRQLF